MTGSLLVVVCVVWESGQVNGGLLLASWVAELEPVGFGYVSVGEPGFSLGGAATRAICVGLTSIVAG